MKNYITYGKGNTFIKDKLPRVEDLNLTEWYFNKVPHTFWGSPVNAKYGWKDWCESEEYNLENLSTSFLWTLKPEAKILCIDKLEDLDKVPFIRDHIGISIDFKTIIKEYDALEICMDNDYIGHMFTSDKEICFNGYDCDSIMVFNRDMIIPL